VIYRCDSIFYDVIGGNAVLNPEKIAAVYGDNSVSISAYQKMCDQCSAGLRKEGMTLVIGLPSYLR